MKVDLRFLQLEQVGIMKLPLALFFTFFAVQAFANSTSEANGDIYVMGMEQVNRGEVEELLKKYPNMTLQSYMNATASGGASKLQRGVVSKVSKTESTESLKNTLVSFQDAIKDLCVSQVELNLAFSTSAKAWVVVNGEVSASVKIIVKNKNENCK